MKRLLAHAGDVPFTSLKTREIRSFLNHLQSIQKRDGNLVSKKTVLNAYIALGALWTFAIKEHIVKEHTVRKVDKPRPEKRKIEAFSEEQYKSLLTAVDYSIPYSREGKRKCQNTCIGAQRDRAVLLFLLDTGVRAQELCDLRLKNVGDFQAKVFGKGSKERIVHFSPGTLHAIEDYLNHDRGLASLTENDFLFTTVDGDQLTRYSLNMILKRISKCSGVLSVHAHRFRHTFAVNYLRNGGDEFSLQALLGHTTYGYG